MKRKKIPLLKVDNLSILIYQYCHRHVNGIVNTDLFQIHGLGKNITKLHKLPEIVRCIFARKNCFQSFLRVGDNIIISVLDSSSG